jgi:hypothetical protein
MIKKSKKDTLVLIFLLAGNARMQQYNDAVIKYILKEKSHQN